MREVNVKHSKRVYRYASSRRVIGGVKVKTPETMTVDRAYMKGTLTIKRSRAR